MSVKKIFVTLITIVACVVIGALVLNTLLPNAAKELINATELMIYKATKLSFDFNADGVTGKSQADSTTETFASKTDTDAEQSKTAAGVAGFN